MINSRIEYSFRFIKSFKKAPRKVQVSFRNRFELLLTDKYHPLLNNHALSGRYKNYRSFNVTGDWRVIFRELDDGEILYFDCIGTHSQLYK